MLARSPRSGALWQRHSNPVSRPFRDTASRHRFKTERFDMTVAIPAFNRRLRPLLAAICLGAASFAVTPQAFARGPDGIADVAEKVIDAVVNISTSQTVEAKGGPGEGGRGAMPQLPPGSPFEEFFDDFFKNRRGPNGPRSGGDMQPHKT